MSPLMSRKPLKSADIINLTAFMNIEKALDLEDIRLFDTTFEESGFIYEVYQFKNIIVFRDWSVFPWSGPFHNAPDSPGRWQDLETGARGPGIISLLQYLGSPAFQQKGLAGNDRQLRRESARKALTCGTEEQTLGFLAERLKIDLDKPVLPPWPMPDGCHQVFLPSKASPKFGSRWEQVSPTYRRAGYEGGLIPVIGSPWHTYRIKGDPEHPEVIVGEWPMDRGRPLLVPFSLTQGVREQWWLPVRLTLPILPYRLKEARDCPSARVLIFDDLTQVDHLNDRLRGDQAAIAIGWPSGLPNMTHNEVAWRGLQDRDVVVPVDIDDRQSVKHAMSLISKLTEAGAKGLTFAPLAECLTGHEDRWAANIFRTLACNSYGVERLTLIAKEKFGLEVPSARTKVTRNWKIGDKRIEINRQYLIENVIENWNIILIYSEPGCGKSFGCLLLGYILGAGGSFFDGRLVALQAGKVLYLAIERPDKCADKLEIIHKSLGRKNAMENIAIFPHPDDRQRLANLGFDEIWEENQSNISDADLIFIDHLTAAASGKLSRVNWGRILKCAETERDKGKTIVFLHHLTKDGDPRGPSEIKADVDYCILMERVDDCDNGVRFVFEKHRNDKSLGKNTRPFELYWDIDDDTGLVSWWTEVVEVKKKTWRAAPEGIIDERRKEAIKAVVNKFSGRQAEIIEALADNHLCGKTGLKSGELAEAIGVKSSETVRTALAPLLEAEDVLPIGNGSGLHYALSSELIDQITIPA